ncbi:MAG: hypothetical protein V1792_15355 [Pseudomonadota bacterium]
MRRFGFIAVVLLLLAAMTIPASAWEMKLKGDTEWRFRYWARTGDKDIFGKMDPTAVNLGVNHLATFPTVGGTQNAPTATFGVLAGENNFGSDMSFTDYRMTIYPKIQVNKAISVEASVNMTSLGIHSDGQPYDNSGNTNRGYENSLYVPISSRPAASNVPNTYVTVQYLKASLNTPMLDFSFGLKDSGLGMGLWKSKSTRSSASFGVSTHYGPFKFGFSPYFTRRLSDWRALDSRNTGDEAQSRKERVRDYFRALQGEIEYKCGPMKITFVSDSYKEDQAPDTTIRGGVIAPGKPSQDTLRYRFHLSFDYFDGRFFAQGEWDWFNRWRAGPAAAASATSVGVGIDNNGMLYGLQLGGVAGPSKVTVNYFRATGDDITTRETNEDAAAGDAGVSSGYVKNWAYLMYYLYGTGTNFNADGYGQPTNMHHLGGRVDYGVAANMNFWATYAYAWRDQPQAYRLGGNYQLGLNSYTNDNLFAFKAGTSPATPVPDSAREIGWEIDLGVNWQILQNLTWNTTCAYWQPGTWWSYAYPNTANIYRTNPGATIAAASTRAGAITGAGREVDPLILMETSLLINF